MAPHCKVEGCDQDIKFWCHYFRRAARGFDGIPLVPIPICRFRCPTAGHGTTSYLPPFLHRYLHYVASVVEVVVETMVVAGARLRELVEVGLDGLCPRTWCKFFKLTHRTPEG